MKTEMLSKKENEIKDSICSAEKLSKECSISELLYFIYLLHIARTFHLSPSSKMFSSSALGLTKNSMTESVKYIVSMIAKNGNFNPKSNKHFDFENFDIPLTQKLLNLCISINLKFEEKGIIQLLDERDVDISSNGIRLGGNDLFNYYFRVENDNKTKTKSIEWPLLLKDLEEEYCKSDVLFTEVFGVTVKDFSSFIKLLMNEHSSCIEEVKENFYFLPNGNIMPHDRKTIENHCICYVYQESKLYKKIGSEYKKLINFLVFNKSDFSSGELRFHEITRKPILNINGFLYISPELLLDSIFTTLHYSLLESANKEKHKTLQSNLFLDKISFLAKKYDFIEVNRELDLFEGKKALGDIDLILKNDNDCYLLIEAKNYALPLDVYFKDKERLNEKLNDLKRNWDRKVRNRLLHLKESYARYGLNSDFLYIVISKSPEIISHHSDILYLSINEFDFWLSNNLKTTSFSEFFNKKYSSSIGAFSEKELELLQNDGLLSKHISFI